MHNADDIHLSWTTQMMQMQTTSIRTNRAGHPLHREHVAEATSLPSNDVPPCVWLTEHVLNHAFCEYVHLLCFTKSYFYMVVTLVMCWAGLGSKAWAWAGLLWGWAWGDTEPSPVGGLELGQIN